MSGPERPADPALRMRRRLVLARAPTAAEAEALADRLRALPGVLGVWTRPGARRVTVEYLASRTDYTRLSRRLAELGYGPARGPWARLRRAWLTLLDENARANAKVPPPACCNRPPRPPR